MFSVFKRGNQYLPLPRSPARSSPSSSWKDGSRLGCVAMVICVGSVLLNVFLLYRPAIADSGLDIYQHLNNHSLLDAASLPVPLRDEPGASHNAIVTSLYTDGFAPAVATLGHTLNQMNSSAARLLFYIPGQASPEALCVASVSGWTPHAVARIPPPAGGRGVGRHFLDQFSKLRLWTLDGAGVRAAVYLDADTLVRRNFDELFGLPYTFAAVPDVRPDARGYTAEFNAGVLFVRPDSGVFDDMLEKIATARYPMGEAEQAFLNVYFGMQALRLPYPYNVNLGFKHRNLALYHDLMREARVVHYTGPKPFLKGDYEAMPLEEIEENVERSSGREGGKFADEMREWGKEWRRTRDTYYQAMEACRREHQIT